jgi:hypothetical protein
MWFTLDGDSRGSIIVMSAPALDTERLDRVKGLLRVEVTPWQVKP